MTHIEVLASDDVSTLVAVDPPACAFRCAAPMGASPHAPSTALVVNANYFDQGVRRPIGMMFDAGEVLPGVIPLAAGWRRTAMVFVNGTATILDPLTADQASELTQGDWRDRGATVIQAGPRLLRAGTVVLDAYLGTENFLRDVGGVPTDVNGVTHSVPHVVIGIDAAGKILIQFSSSLSLRAAAQRLIEVGAVDAMNLDGGHPAHLSFASLTPKGAPNPFTALIAIPEP